MRRSDKCARLQGFLGVALAAWLAWLACSERALAFGGLWSSHGAVLKQSAERVILVDHPDSTITAIIQLRYAGPAQQFAWLVPVPGTPQVAVSSSVVFDRLEAATAPQYWLEVSAQDSCMSQPGGASEADVSGQAAMATGSVVVLDQGSVGPYDYVTLAVDPQLSDAAQVATDWLATHHYDLTGLDAAALRPYLQQGLNLLAFKLESGADAGAIRPLMLSYEAEQPVIPLRPTALAAADDMPLQVWVVGPSQAVPTNYLSLVLNDAVIDWLSGETFVAGTLPAGGVGPAGPATRTPSNYDAVVSAAANEAGGQGFVTEFGEPSSWVREELWSALDQQTLQRITSQSYADGLDAILAARGEYAGWDGWQDALKGATRLPAGVTLQAFAEDPERFRGAAKVDAARFLELLQRGVVQPVADSAALFQFGPYLTRLYTTMSADEMTLDPSFGYNAELAQVSNIHVARQTLRCDVASTPPADSFRVELPQGGVVTGPRADGWPVADGSLPANLEIVTLGTQGSGSVTVDNSAAIGNALPDNASPIAGDPPGEALPAPQNGLLIGGTQSVRPRPQPTASSTASQARAGDACSVVSVGRRCCGAWLFWAPALLLVVLGLRRGSVHA